MMVFYWLVHCWDGGMLPTNLFFLKSRRIKHWCCLSGIFWLPPIITVDQPWLMRLIPDFAAQCSTRSSLNRWISTKSNEAQQMLSWKQFIPQQRSLSWSVLSLLTNGTVPHWWMPIDTTEAYIISLPRDSAEPNPRNALGHGAEWHGASCCASWCIFICFHASRRQITGPSGKPKTTSHHWPGHTRTRNRTRNSQIMLI